MNAADGTPTRQPPSVLGALFEDPRAFSFIQAVRLLRRAQGQPGKAGELDFLRGQLRIRPHLSLAFPPTDLTALRELGVPGQDPTAARRFQLDATFLGLYGPSSPLPTYYTEELLDEQREDQSVSRDFLDILDHCFFVLYVLADSYYQLIHQVCEEQDPDVLTRLYALVGLGHPELIQRPFRHPGALLRAAGLFTQFPRSAAGLRCVLADRLGTRVEVVQCRPRVARIPADQWCLLGDRNELLGTNAWVGSQVADAMGMIAVRLGPLNAATFRRYLPGTEDYAELLLLIRFYCTQPVEFDLEFVLSPDEVQPPQLGTAEWCALGQDTWLAPAPGECVSALYPNCRRQSDPPASRGTHA